MLLLAGVSETAVLPALERALPTLARHDVSRLAHATPPTRRRLLLTLLFLGAVGLRRTWDLRGYTGDALALLTGRRRAYGYRTAERFLSEFAAAGGADAVTDALAAWTATLWGPEPRPARDRDARPSFYIDGHRKAVFSGALIPRGLVARRGTVLGCRALVLLHDAAGHPLLVTTHRGDLHLTAGAPALLARYERHGPCVSGVIIDREGMAAEFLRQLTMEGRQVITVLRSDQYAGLSSFAEVGAFVPLQHDRRGALVREVAPARYSLALPDHPEERLDVCVALVRDLRRRVPCPPAEVEAQARARRASDDDEALDERDEPYYLDDAWTATPAPAAPMMDKLIPVVTTAADADPVALARTYFHRWPAQENIIKDWLLPLGVDTNHGYAKTAVINSEVAKRRTALEQRLDRVKRWTEAALARSERAGRSYDRLWTQAKKRSDGLYRALNARQAELRAQGVDEYVCATEIKERKRVAATELEERWARAQRA